MSRHTFTSSEMSKREVLVEPVRFERSEGFARAEIQRLEFWSPITPANY